MKISYIKNLENQLKQKNITDFGVKLKGAKTMAFFKKIHKRIAMYNSKESLEQAYHLSEMNLKKASLSGNEKLLKTAMKEHGNLEYALLYQNSPEFKKRR